MIIPIRCMTCGKVLADKWEYYEKRCKELEKEETTTETSERFFDKHLKGKVLDELKLNKMCCRRPMLGHLDLIETI